MDDEQAVPQDVERRRNLNGRGESKGSGDVENRSGMWNYDSNSISSDLISSL